MSGVEPPPPGWHGEALRIVHHEMTRVGVQLAAAHRALEERFIAAQERERETWWEREAELERRIADERAAGERRAGEVRDELRGAAERAAADAARARRDAERARLEREQERERHRGAELAWMSERRAHLARIGQLELELARHTKGRLARWLRRA